MGGGPHLAPVGELNGRAVDLDAVDELPARAQEVVPVAGRVERDDVGSEHALEHGRPPRQPREHLGRRERHVEEEADAPLRTRLAEQLRQQQQVVVVHPAEAGHGRIVRRREVCVDEPVGVPPRPVEGRPLDEPVQQRPERSVREAVVVRVDLAARQRHGAKLDLEPLDLPSASRSRRPSPPTRRRGTSSRGAER